MEDMVAQYYGVQQGSDDYKKVFAYVQQFNQLQKFGGMQYPDKNIINLPDFIPAEITGNKLDRKADPSNPDERLRLATQDIPIRAGGRYARPAAAGHMQATGWNLHARVYTGG